MRNYHFSSVSQGKSITFDSLENCHCYRMLIANENGEQYVMGHIRVKMRERAVVVVQKKSADNSEIAAHLCMDRGGQFDSLEVHGISDGKKLQVKCEKRGEKLRYENALGDFNSKGKVRIPGPFFENNTWLYDLKSILAGNERLDCLILIPEGPLFVGMTVSLEGKDRVIIGGRTFNCLRYRLQSAIKNSPPQFALYEEAKGVLMKYVNGNYSMELIDIEDL